LRGEYRYASFGPAMLEKFSHAVGELEQLAYVPVVQIGILIDQPLMCVMPRMLFDIAIDADDDLTQPPCGSARLSDRREQPRRSTTCQLPQWF